MTKTIFIAPDFFCGAGDRTAARIPGAGTDGVAVGRCVARIGAGADAGTGGGAAAERGG